MGTSGQATEYTFLKDPDSTLDYAFDWSEWLEQGESISSHVITVDDGITKDSSGNSGTVVTVWLSGGTAGTNYNIACQISTRPDVLLNDLLLLGVEKDE